MSAVGKALVVVGGTVITAGLVGLWLKEHPIVPPKPKCEEYFTESECIGAGCYWYNNRCNEYPEHPTETHYDCTKDPMTGLILCSLIEGAGDDKCDPYSPPDFCWSKVGCESDRECGTGARCWNGRCYWLANEYLNWEGKAKEWVKFSFESRVIGNKIIGGSITFTLAPWKFSCAPHVRIYLVRDGKRVRTVYDKYHESMSETYFDPVTRTDPIEVVFFEAEAVDGIEVWCMCEIWWLPSEPILTGVHSQFAYL